MAADMYGRTVFLATILRPSGDTGVHTHMTEFLHWARAHAIDTRLVTPFDASRLLVYPLFGMGRMLRPFSTRFWVWWHRWSHALMLTRQLRRRLRDHGRSGRKAIVYAQDPISANVAIALREAGAPIDVVLVVHFNGSHAEELATQGLITRGGPLERDVRRAERAALANADRVIFPSRHAAATAGVRLEDADACRRYWCVANFVSRPMPTAWTPRRAHPIDDAITIGTLEPRKNHAFILQVLAEAHRRGHRYTLTIVGSGPLASPLRDSAAQLGLARYVTFAGRRSDAAALIERHRVYVHAAHIENCPMALIEAMAVGVPIVAAPVGGIPEMITDGVEGFFWSLRDVTASTDRLVAILEHESRRRRMAAAARRRYERQHAPATQGPLLLRALFGTDVQAGRGPRPMRSIA